MPLRIGTIVYQCGYTQYAVHELDTPNPQVTSGSNNNIRHLYISLPVLLIQYPILYAHAIL